MSFACRSTEYMLLATAYAVEAKLCSELNWDCMGDIVQEFVDLLAFIVSYCRGSFHAWGFAITPDKCHSKHFFTQFYFLLLKGFNHILKDLVPCAVQYAGSWVLRRSLRWDKSFVSWLGPVFSNEICFQCNCPVFWSRCSFKHTLLQGLHLSLEDSGIQAKPIQQLCVPVPRRQ